MKSADQYDRKRLYGKVIDQQITNSTQPSRNKIELLAASYSIEYKVLSWAWNLTDAFHYWAKLNYIGEWKQYQHQQKRIQWRAVEVEKVDQATMKIITPFALFL